MMGFSTKGRKIPIEDEQDVQDIFLDEGIVHEFPTRLTLDELPNLPGFVGGDSANCSYADSSIFPNSYLTSDIEKRSNGTSSTESDEQPMAAGAAASLPQPPASGKKKRRSRRVTPHQQRCMRILFVSFSLLVILVLGIGALLYYWMYEDDSIFDFLKRPTSSTIAPPLEEEQPDYEFITLAPSFQEGESKTADPTNRPTASPTLSPTDKPSATPTISPTRAPPTRSPTVVQGIAASEYLRTTYGVQFPDDPEAPSNVAIRRMAEEAAKSGDDLVFDGSLLQRFSMLTVSMKLRKPVSEADDLEDLNRTGIDTYGDIEINECEWTGVICVNSTVIKLSLGSLGIHGRIPAEIGYLSELVYLDLSNNLIDGPLPESLYGLTNLEELYMYKNRLSGTLSERIGDLASLTHLHLSHNRFSGGIPNAMSSTTFQKKYKYINLYSNFFSGSVPENLGWTDVWYLDLGRNQFSGRIPDDIYTMSSLRHLHLDSNKFDGLIPWSLPYAGENQIETISLEYNALSGAIPSFWDTHEDWNVVSLTVQNNTIDRSTDKSVCSMDVLESERWEDYVGKLVEFKADCSACRCKKTFCQQC